MHFTLRSATLFLSLWIALSPAAAGLAQDPDGPKHIFVDALLEHFVGNWKLTGNVMGHAAEHSVADEWVLNHQFVRLPEIDNAPAITHPRPYQALTMVVDH